jgi:hypothetical protein
MSVLKEIELEDNRSSDRMWWSMAALVGLISLWLPQLLQAEPARVTQVVISESALFFTGALIGSLRPDRVWRWGAASLLAVALRDLALLAVDPRLAGIGNQAIGLYLLANSPLYLIHMLFVLAGAYVGTYTMREQVQ